MSSWWMRRRCILCGIKSLSTDQLGGTSSSQRDDCCNCCLLDNDLRGSSDDTRHNDDNQLPVTSTIARVSEPAWQRVQGKTSSSVAVARVTFFNGKCHRKSTLSYLHKNTQVILQLACIWREFLICWDQHMNKACMREFRREISQKWVIQNKWNKL